MSDILTFTTFGRQSPVRFLVYTCGYLLGIDLPPPRLSSRNEQSTPAWLSAAVVSLQAKWADDKFEAVLRKFSPEATPEWRMKCLDCPGKLYNLGPGHSLSNYEVHLKNRQHQLRVSSRIKGTAS